MSIVRAEGCGLRHLVLPGDCTRIYVSGTTSREITGNSLKEGAVCVAIVMRYVIFHMVVGHHGSRLGGDCKTIYMF